MSAILRCVCTALNIPPRRVLDPKGTYEMIDDWWGAARNLLGEPDVVHTLQRNIYGTALKSENADALRETMRKGNDAGAAAGKEKNHDGTGEVAEVEAEAGAEAGELTEGKEAEGAASTAANHAPARVPTDRHPLVYSAGDDGDGYMFLETLSKWIFALVENLECREALRPLRNKESAL